MHFGRRRRRLISVLVVSCFVFMKDDWADRFKSSFASTVELHGLELITRPSFGHKQPGVPPYLSGFVCAFHPAALGLSPKHTVYALVNLY